ncbi:MAG: hypothetical protein IH849_04845 [Acidobacteria bacterium]|nr:hypothetical protein [Acidobacteriota bacterium]
MSSLTAALLAFWTAGCSVLTDETPVPALSGAIHVNEPDHQVWIEALRAQGLDAVQVTLYARQQAWDSPELMVPDDADAVIGEIRTAKAAGLGVTLVLRVALEQGLASNRHYWHGMIWLDDGDVPTWFRNYREFALWAAALAAAEDVDLLVLGSELNSLTSTVPVDEVPGLYAYFLDPEKTAAVRERLVGCAATIPPEDLTSDLRFVDGGGYETLDEYLRAQEAADRAWTQHITGASRPEDVDLDRLNARRATYERYWRELIANVRTVYGGPLSYAANFDQVQEVGFWDALDVVGATAYFSLSLRGLETERLEEVLTASWLRIAGELNELANRHGGPGRVLPVMFFELGWTRKAASTVRPFSYHRVEVLETAPPAGSAAPPSLTCVHWATAPDDPFERVRALEALDRVVEQGAFPTLRGFTIWKLTTDPAHRQLEPFAVVIPASTDPGSDAGDADTADRAFLQTAARLAQRLRRSAGAER